MPLDAAPTLVLRRLGDSDRPALLRHLLALHPECRHARFGSARSDAHLAAFSASLDLAGSILGIAAFVGSDAVAVALAAECGEGMIEVGVETLPFWRRRGLGAAVCRAACVAAAARGATRALFEFEPTNFAIRALVHTLGGSVSLPDGRGTVPLRPGISEEQLRPRSVSGKRSGADDPAPVPSSRAPAPTLHGPGVRYRLRKGGAQAAMISC